ncbi:MAG: cupin domain-containing protein [Halieaceae bacterium]|nr:cupin domain-containing protein [Halieaceae bacterium]
MHPEISDFVNRIESSNTPWLPYGLVEGCSFRVLKTHEASNTVVLNFLMPPNCTTQLHDHFCTAMAYTLEGEWMYGNQVFKQGDLAFEVPGEIHQPVTGEAGAQLLTILFGGPGENRFLRNFEEDGSSYTIGMPFLKAVEGITPAELEQIDLEALLQDYTPPDETAFPQ